MQTEMESNNVIMMQGIFYPTKMKESMGPVQTTFLEQQKSAMPEPSNKENFIGTDGTHEHSARQKKVPKAKSSRGPCEYKNRPPLDGSFFPRRAVNSHKKLARSERFNELLRVAEELEVRDKQQGIDYVPTDGLTKSRPAINVFKLGHVTETLTTADRLKAHLLGSFTTSDTTHESEPELAFNKAILENRDCDSYKRFVESITMPIVGAQPNEQTLAKRNIRAGNGLLWHMGMSVPPSSFQDQISIVGVKKSDFGKLMDDPLWVRYFLKAKDDSVGEVSPGRTLSYVIHPELKSMPNLIPDQSCKLECEEQFPDKSVLSKMYLGMKSSHFSHIRPSLLFIETDGIIWDLAGNCKASRKTVAAENRHLQIVNMLRQETYYLGSFLIADLSSTITGVVAEERITAELTPSLRAALQDLAVPDAEEAVFEALLKGCLDTIRYIQVLTHAPAYAMLTPVERHDFFYNLAQIFINSNNQKWTHEVLAEKSSGFFKITMDSLLRRANRWLTGRIDRIQKRSSMDYAHLLSSYLAEKWLRCLYSTITDFDIDSGTLLNHYPIYRSANIDANELSHLPLDRLMKILWDYQSQELEIAPVFENSENDCTDSEKTSSDYTMIQPLNGAFIASLLKILFTSGLTTNHNAIMNATQSLLKHDIFLDDLAHRDRVLFYSLQNVAPNAGLGGFFTKAIAMIDDVLIHQARLSLATSTSNSNTKNTNHYYWHESANLSTGAKNKHSIVHKRGNPTGTQRLPKKKMGITLEGDIKDFRILDEPLIIQEAQYLSYYELGYRNITTSDELPHERMLYNAVIEVSQSSHSCDAIFWGIGKTYRWLIHKLCRLYGFTAISIPIIDCDKHPDAPKAMALYFYPDRLTPSSFVPLKSLVT